MRQKKPIDKPSKSSKSFVGNVAWDEFVAWCIAKNLNPLPAHPWTLAAYIRTLEEHMSPPNIRKHLADVSKAHAEKSKKRPERDPLIGKTIEIIEKRAEKTALKAKKLDDEDLSDPTAPKTKKSKTSAKKKAGGPKAKSTSTRSMRATPKLVKKPQVK
ncbi:MAG: hypothetical protein OSA23_05210 [Rhodospirillales bacterium]|nr:hypothetical protein [Rhodospirillales bacterium]